MARLSSYQQDGNLSGEDRLVGSSYEGPGQNGPIYKTRTYKLSELGAYISTYIDIGGINIQDIYDTITNLENSLTTLINNNGSSITLLSTTVTDNTSALASAQQSITAVTTDQQAQATFQTNLAASFGTYDENGNITSFSQATADQILQATASDKYATSQFATNLASSVGVYDENGNLVTLSTAFADQVLQTTTSDKYATSQFVTKLRSNFGTYDVDGNLIELSSGFANQILETTSEAGYATSEFATNIASSIGTYAADGTIISVSNAFATQAYNTATKPDFAEAEYVNNLGASIGSLNPDGTLEFDINSSYSQGIKTYIENNSAVAESIEILQATYATLPVTIRQPEPPDILDPITSELNFPLGSIWVDTDDSNALYVLIEDAGDPIGYSWSPTTSEALGDLILSNSQLQDEVNILSTNISTEATRLESLRSKFGYFDINTGEFIVENTSEVISSLRTYADSQSAAAQLAETVRAQVNDGENSIIAQVQAASEASVTADGFARASYGLNVQAGNVITGVTFVAEDDTISTTSQVIFNTADFIIQNGSGITQLSINGSGDAVFAGDISAATGTFTGGVSGTGYSLNNSGLSLTNAGSEINIGNGVIIDSNGISGTNFTLNSTGLTATNGTFSGIFTAGDITIDDSNIEIIAPGDITFKDSSSNQTGRIYSNGSILTITADQNVSIQSSNGGVYTNVQGTFVESKNNLPMWLDAGQYNFSTTNSPTGGFTFIGNNTGNFSVADVVAASITAPIINNYASTQFYVQSGGTIFAITPSGVTINGSPVGTGTATDTNYYLSNITKSGNTLTFVVSGTSNVSYTFGANAFNSTTIPTNNNQLTNGAGYVTAATQALTYYYTKTQTDSGFMPRIGGEFTGSISTQVGSNMTSSDFILHSDATLKENIKEYKIKPINIQYKEYNLIGDDSLRVGVIAQELEKDHPEFVKMTDNGTKSVSYIDMLVAKVAELEQRIKKLENGAA